MHRNGDYVNPSPSSNIPPVRPQPARGCMAVWLKRVLLGLLAIVTILPLSGALYQTIATEVDKRNLLPPG